MDRHVFSHSACHSSLTIASTLLFDWQVCDNFLAVFRLMYRLLFWGRTNRPSAAVPGEQTLGSLYWMSNFYAAPIIYHGRRYPSSEHLYQALKFSGTDDAWAEEIRKAPTTTVAKRMGNSREHTRRADWDNERVQTMEDVVTLKFEQHPSLRLKLMDTGRAELMEDARSDRFWGAGTPGKPGENHLGKVLERVRAHYTGH